MNEKLNYLLEYHYSLFYADCVNRGINDENISLEDFKTGLKKIRFAVREEIVSN